MTESLRQNFLYVPIPALVISIGIHLGFGVLFATLHMSGILKSSSQLKKSLYQDFIQVDIVALPDELPNQNKVIDVSEPIVEVPKSQPKVAMAEPDTMVLPSTKKMEKPMDTVLNQKEQEKALQTLAEEAHREKALKLLAMNREKGGRTQFKGNIVAQGNARIGELGTPKDIYDAKVRQAIQEHFNVYSWQKKKALVTIVHIELYPSGRVRRREIRLASSDKIYDAAVLQAIDRAQPLPVPADLSLIRNGITVEFKPTE